MVRVGILGSGDVGKSLALGFAKSGHEVKIGTRSPEKLAEWLRVADGKRIMPALPPDAVGFGEIVVICCKGTAVEEAINGAGAENFSGKTVIDVTNPLSFRVEGQPPEFGVALPDSNGVKVQALLSDAKVVKAFNTVPAKYMCSPNLEDGEPDLFICGNDAEAKEKVTGIASHWGWSVIDMGDIEQAYLLEALAMLWIRFGFLNNHWTHAFKLLRK